MNDVFVVASFMTHFQRWPEKSHLTLAREALAGLQADAGMANLTAAESVHFGSCAMHAFGQTNIRGQVVLTPLAREGVVDAHAPITNVEGGCATGSMAFHGAVNDVASGNAKCSLALGVEKTFVPDPKTLASIFDGGIDQLDKASWQKLYADAADACGTPFAPHPMRIVMLDVCAMKAGWHMKTYGTTREQLAAGASKNHANGAKNPKAQYRQEMSVAEVLADKAILGPFTRSMCAPISDGAAAALVCSKEFLQTLPPEVRARAVKVRASVLAGGAFRGPAEESVTSIAAKKAYARAGVTPAQIKVTELHDATSFAEIETVEALGFCKPGEGGPFVASGATALTGTKPVNSSGGLVSKGHPLAATGLAMLSELHAQLRGDAGPRQVNADLALLENAGGFTGFDESVCAISILERVA